jgi:multiple antibiotic resistance protein
MLSHPFKLKRQGLRRITILLLFLLMIALHLSVPDLAVAQSNVTCPTDLHQSCQSSEAFLNHSMNLNVTPSVPRSNSYPQPATPSSGANSFLAQALSPTPALDNPSASTAKSALLPKQRIADQIIRAPLDAPFGFFNLFIILFVTLGPIKVIPPFVQLTKNADRHLRQQLAFRSAALATIVILLVVIVGQNMVHVWQIRLPSLLIAGGILLFLVALNLVMTQYDPPPPPTSSDPPSLKLAITPLTFPVILPPFGIAIALVLMLISQELDLSPLIVLGTLVLVMLLNLIGMLAARPILKFLKPVTLRILGFVLGVLQLALGIEWIITGLEIEALVFRQLFGS